MEFQTSGFSSGVPPHSVAREDRFDRLAEHRRAVSGRHDEGYRQHCGQLTRRGCQGSNVRRTGATTAKGAEMDTERTTLTDDEILGSGSDDELSEDDADGTDGDTTDDTDGDSGGDADSDDA